jgi:transposase
MKKPKVLSAGDVLGIIPDSLLDQFAQDSGVDVQVKKLKGKTILQLFLYGALNFRTISQRILAAVYASDEFRMLFETTGNAVKFSAISMRLGNIKVSYFENIFNYLINSKQVSSVCFADTKVGIEKLDSTFLGLSSKLLKFGMDFNPGRKNVKFGVKLSGSIPVDIQLFTDSSDISEDRVFPKLLMEKQQKQALNIVVFDRGMNKRENFINLNQNNIYFISRFRNTYKTDTTKEIPLTEQTTKSLTDLQEQEIRFANYTLKGATDKDSTFRLIKGTNKDSKEIIYFLTNVDFLTAAEITDLYKSRWEIETFFKFIKQELNFKHLLSRNENGIKAVMYLTMITAILLTIYKKVNHIVGWAITKFKFMEDLQRAVMYQWAPQVLQALNEGKNLSQTQYSSG